MFWESLAGKSMNGTYEVSVHSEQQGTLKQQDASIDLRLLGVAVAESVKHCLAEPVLLGVGVDGWGPGGLVVGDHRGVWDLSFFTRDGGLIEVLVGHDA